MKLNILGLLSTCMEVSVSLLCLFLHEPPYQTIVVCCNLIFAVVLYTWITVATIFYITVELTQAHPNNPGYALV